MKNAVFVAPYFLDATERFIDAATRVGGARIGLVSCDPVEKLAPPTRNRLAAHFAVPSIQTEHLLAGVQAIGREFGSVDSLFGMLEQIQVPLGEIRDQLGIAGMSAQVARGFRDKSRMKDVLRAAGIPCARHRLAGSREAALDFAQETGYPVVVKPPDGAGAKGIFRCEQPHQLDQCLTFLQASDSQPVLLEEFITGREYSFDSVCLHGQMVWHSISHYFPSPLEVVREPWIQWCVLIPRENDGDEYQEIRRLAPAALQALGLQSGLSHMEWFRRPDGSVAISEVGARPPGAQFTTLISAAHDFDLYEAWAHLMIHNEFAGPPREFACGAAYLRAMPGRNHDRNEHGNNHGSGVSQITGIEGLPEIARELGDLVVEAKLPKLGQQPASSYEGDGYVIIRHRQTDVVKQALHRIITGVRVDSQRVDSHSVS